jgi:hypothetical protein
MVLPVSGLPLAILLSLALWALLALVAWAVFLAVGA